jgi:tetratricopeptide (TPR) repeat protein
VPPPRVFISYSHDNQQHRERVLALANQLRTDGINAWLDRYEQAPPEGWPRWMERQLREADFMLVVCTQTYRRRFDALEEPGKGLGVTWEGLLATQLLYESGTFNRKLVPVLFSNATDDTVPLLLRPFARFRLPDDYQALYRLLTQQPEVTAPPLGGERVLPAPTELPSLEEPPARSEGLPSLERDPDLLATLTTEITNLRQAIERMRAGAPSPLPFSKEWWWAQLDRCLGRRLAIVAMATAVVAGFVWMNWSRVQAWPAVSTTIEWITQADLPVPDPGFFNVGIAHLAEDDGEQERKLHAALRELEGIKVAVFDRTISTTNEKLQEGLEGGHEEAKRYLAESEYDALLWGEVLGSGADVALKLYWTTAPGDRRSTEAFNFERNQTLPALFWSELEDVLKLVVTTSAAQFDSESGKFVADRLAPFVERVRNLVAQDSAQRSDLADADLRRILAGALAAMGEQKGDNSLMVEAIDIYRQALQEYTRERSPLDWAATQNNLGAALQTLGARESDNTHLEEAVIAYGNALKERTRERVPLDWAATQNNLGNALLALGERESGTTRLREAVDAYRNALQEHTRERAPLDWAGAQNNLGNALLALGERESGTARLEEAADAYRDALQELTRERVPLLWATTHNNLGNALQTLGARESDNTHLEEAVTAYRDALQERTRERVPLDWAGTQNNLGNALQTLGERESGTTRLEEAVAAYRDALHERTRERVPLDWATTQSNLGNALSALGDREPGTTRLEEAVAAYSNALQEHTRERAPLLWASTQNNLGAALQALGERESDTSRLEEAVIAYRDALQERTRERVPLLWADTQNNLGVALRALGELKSDTACLEEAVTAYRNALEERTRELDPLLWAKTQNNLGVALRVLGEREAGTARLEEAAAAFESALAVFSKGSTPHPYEITLRNLERTRAEVARRSGN